MNISPIAVRMLLCAATGLLATPLQASNCERVFTASFDVAAPLTLFGNVYGLEQGTVELRVAGALASAPFEYGFFTIDLPPAPPEAVLRVIVRGVDDQAYVELATHEASIRQLHLEATTTPSGPPAYTPIEVSPRTTARYALTTLGNAGISGVESDCRLDELQAAIDPAIDAEYRALLRIALDSGGFGAKASAGAPATTLDLLLDPQAFADEIGRLETAQPGLFQQTLDIIETPLCDLLEGRRLRVLRNRATQMNRFIADVQDFASTPLPLFTSIPGQSTFSLQCTGDHAQIEYDSMLLNEIFVTREIDGVPQQVRRQLYLTSEDIESLDPGAAQVVLDIDEEQLVTYPDHPQLPDEIVHARYSQTALVVQSLATALDPAVAPGEYVFPVENFMFPRHARAQLESDGSGVLVEGGAVTWTTIDDGGLVLALTDRTITLMPYRDDGPTRDVVALIEPDADSAFTNAGLVARRDVSLAWVESEVPGSYLQGAGRNREFSGPFVFELASDFSAFNASADRHYGWQIEDGRLVLRNCTGTVGNIGLLVEPVAGQCTNTYERRIFDLFQRQGDDLYLLEERSSWFGGVDPAAAPPGIEQFLLRLYGYSAPSP